jgi:DNA-binding PadR family transcriptional regulator
MFPIYVFIVYVFRSRPVSTPLTPLSLQILVSLGTAPLHGYGILKAIDDRTDGAETPSTGALYLALQRLEEEGRIRPCADPPTDADARRKYWEITPEGLRAVRGELDRMEALLKHRSVEAVRAGGGTAGA